MQADYQPIFCPQCSEVLQPDELSNHIAICSLSREQKLQNLTRSKKKDIFPCQFCGERVIATLYEKHKKVCLAKDKIFCENCRTLYPLETYEKHIQECFEEQPYIESPIKIMKKVSIPEIFPEQLELQDLEAEMMEFDFGDYEPEYNQPYFQEDHPDFHIEQKQKVKGLSELEMDKLKKVLCVKKRQQCAICQQKMIPREKVIKLSCGHMFHKGCIFPWLKDNAYCPMCRKHAITNNKKE